MAAFAGLGLYVWLAVQVYLSKRDPETCRAWDGPLAWIVGPPAESLEVAARGRIERALAALNDFSLPAAERMRRHREELLRAEALLVRSLRAQPAQARALAALAAVRWELDPPLAEAAVAERLRMIALASSMAPTYPEVQRELGELLLRMGRREEALGYLARSVELDPALAAPVVEVLEAQLFPAEAMRAALPRQPLVLASLERAYFEEGRGADYRAIVEGALAEGLVHPVLVARLGEACLRLGDARGLVERLAALGERDEPALEAERLEQRSRAWQALGDTAAAVADSRAARALEPERPWRSERLGDVLLAAGEPAAAVEAFQAALAAAARGPAGPHDRARVYRKLGQAEEARGGPDRAYDAYRRALELYPEEPHAAARVAAMEREAGF